MKNGILVLGTILLFGFTPKENITEKLKADTPEKSDGMVKEISTFSQIIDGKLKMADLLDARAALLFEENINSSEGLKLSQEAQLQRMMTLKYKAAIACRTQF